MRIKAFTKAVSLLLTVGVVAACADVTTSSSSADGSVTTTPTSGTVSATEVTTTSVIRTTSTFAPSAAEALDDYFAAVLVADEAITAVARSFNAGFNQVDGTLTTEAKEAVAGLDIGDIARLIPAGLSIELETAALTVYSDLVSRWAALDGAGRYLQPGAEPDDELAAQNLEFALRCFGNGHSANARFDDDLAEALRLARAELPPPVLVSDSTEAGVLAVRVEYIRAANWCCDGCGGLIYTEPFPVDWENRAGFDAEFMDGNWMIQLHAG